MALMTLYITPTTPSTPFSYIGARLAQYTLSKMGGVVTMQEDNSDTDTPTTHNPVEDAPGLKPESSANAEGVNTGTVPGDHDPTSDDGYEEKPESTEESEGGDSEE